MLLECNIRGLRCSHSKGYNRPKSALSSWKTSNPNFASSPSCHAHSFSPLLSKKMQIPMHLMIWWKWSVVCDTAWKTFFMIFIRAIAWIQDCSFVRNLGQEMQILRIQSLSKLEKIGAIDLLSHWSSFEQQNLAPVITWWSSMSKVAPQRIVSVFVVAQTEKSVLQCFG